MSSENLITEIPVEEWPILRDMYKGDWPKNFITYFIIDHAFKHWKQGWNLLLNKTFSIVHFNTLNGSLTKIEEISNILGDIWVQFVIITSKNLIPLIKHLESLAGGHYKNEPNTLFYMDKEKALKLDIPKQDDISLRPLTEDDAVTVNELWPHRFEGSVHFVENLIRTDFSIAAFSSSDDLLAWILRYPTGSVAMLQVKEEYYRKGLGKLVTTAMTKKLAENGLDSSATILQDNTASRNLFKAIGYEEMYDVLVFRRVD